MSLIHITFNLSFLFCVSRYITILPTIHVSMTLSPDEAILVRHADEMSAASQAYQQAPDWMHAAEILGNPNQSSPLDIVLQRLTRYPRSTLELVATVLFVIANVLIVTFSTMWMYKCMCSRNYARWRTAWNRNRKSKKASAYYKKIRESLPIVLRGHVQARKLVLDFKRKLFCLNTEHEP